MNEWKTVEIGSLCTGIFDGPHATPKKTDSGPVFLGISSLKNGRIDLSEAEYLSEEDFVRWTRRVKPQEGDVVFSYETRLGEAALIPAGLRCCLGRRMALMRPNTTKVDPRFLLFAFLGPEFQNIIRARTVHGSTVDRIPLLDFPKFPLRVPPRREQQAIACILGTLDDKIELNRRRNRTLEAMARAIFQSWFVDFDPVKAKAAVRREHPRWTNAQVSRAACPKLKPEIAELFPDRFEDSPLGPIPKGWRVGTVGDVAEFNGWTLGKRDGLEEIDYIEISEVMRGEIAKITRYVRGEEPGRARRRLRHGDTAISTVRPDRGSYFLCLDPSPTLIASTGFAVLTAKNGHWAFVHVLTTRKEFGEELGRLADGGAYPAVRPEVIAAQQVILPNTDKLLNSFEKIAQPLFLHAQATRNESRTLAALRDALLPKLISGELRVPDAERIVGRAL